MTGAGKVHRRDAMSSHKRNSLEDCFLNEYALQPPGGLVKTAGPHLWRLWSSRLEWGPIICVSRKFPGPDAASPDHTLHYDTQRAFTPKFSLYPTAKTDLFALHPSMAPFANRESTSSRSSDCLHLWPQHVSYLGLTFILWGNEVFPSATMLFLAFTPLLTLKLHPLPGLSCLVFPAANWQSGHDLGASSPVWSLIPFHACNIVQFL